MKKMLVFVIGFLLLASALTLVLLTWFSPDNELFATLWSWGLLTFRGERSLMVIYLMSGLLAVLGVCLFVTQARKKKDV